MANVNIVLSGIFYPVAILRYFLAALQRRDDVNLFTVGAFTGTYIPWGGGMRLPPEYVYKPDVSLGTRPVNLPIGLVEHQIPFLPDIWIQVDAGMHFIGHPAHGRNIIIGTDPHVLDYSDARRYADEFYCMQSPYMQPGDRYLPYAYDPVYHAAAGEIGGRKRYDVSLIGLHYPNRNRIMIAVGNMGLRTFYSVGQAYGDAARIYHDSLMGLNYSSRDDLTARVFELAAMGVHVIANDVPDLHRFFAPSDLSIVSSPDEAIEKIVYYADRPDESAKIARRGHKAVAPHTWDARVETIIKGESYEYN